VTISSGSKKHFYERQRLKSTASLNRWRQKLLFNRWLLKNSMADILPEMHNDLGKLANFLDRSSQTKTPHFGAYRFAGK